MAGAWQPLLISLALLSSVLLWIHSFELVFSDDTVSYKTLFGGTRSFRIADIETAAIKMNFEQRGSGLITLVLQPRPGVDQPPLYINLKPFKAHELSAFFGLLNARLRALGRPEVQRPSKKVDRFFHIPKPAGPNDVV